MKVIVVGGGIAGLSLALSLRQAGIAVRVYEAVGDIGSAWRRHQFAAQAVRELTELGLARRACADRDRHTRIDLLQQARSADLERAKGSRGRLQLARNIRCIAGRASNFAASRCRASASAATMSAADCGSRIFSKISDRVSATFGPSRLATLLSDEADVLVGADGIHSAVRRQLYPNEGEPHFARQLLWRAAIDAEPFLGGAHDDHCGAFQSADHRLSDRSRRAKRPVTD